MDLESLLTSYVNRVKHCANLGGKTEEEEKEGKKKEEGKKEDDMKEEGKKEDDKKKEEVQVATLDEYFGPR